MRNTHKRNLLSLARLERFFHSSVNTIVSIILKNADAGVILLNGGEVVARKAYPRWNGKEYTNSEGETYVVEEELADLMYFSAVNLMGV